MNTSSKIDLKSAQDFSMMQNFTNSQSYLSFLWSNFDEFGFVLKLSVSCIWLYWFEISMINVSLSTSFKVSIIWKIDFEALWVTLISYILTHKFLTFLDSQTLKLVFCRSSLSHNLLFPFCCCDLMRTFHQILHFETIDDFTFLHNNKQFSRPF